MIHLACPSRPDRTKSQLPATRSSDGKNLKAQSLHKNLLAKSIIKYFLHSTKKPLGAFRKTAQNINDYKTPLNKKDFRLAITVTQTTTKRESELVEVQ